MKKFIVNLLFDLLYITVSLILTCIAYFMLNTVAYLILKPFILSNGQAYNLVITVFSMILFSMLLIYFKYNFKKNKISNQRTREDLSILFWLPALILINAFSKSNLTILLKPIFLLNGIIKNEALSYFISLVILIMSYYIYLYICRKTLEKQP